MIYLLCCPECDTEVVEIDTIDAYCTKCNEYLFELFVIMSENHIDDIQDR